MNADKNNNRESVPLVDSAQFRIKTGHGTLHLNSGDRHQEIKTRVRATDHASAKPGLTLSDDGELDVEHYVSLHVTTTDMGLEEATGYFDIEPDKAVKLGRKLMTAGNKARGRNKNEDDDSVVQQHQGISVKDEDGVYHQICACELTDSDINDDGTVSFPLDDGGCSLTKDDTTHAD